MTEKLKKKIEEQIALMRNVQSLEVMLLGPRPPYHWQGHCLEWGKDMPKRLRAKMYEEALVAVLLDMGGVPVKILFADADNTLREGIL